MTQNKKQTNIEYTLNELAAYYEKSRGVGHTTLMMDGVKNYKSTTITPPIVVCGNIASGNSLLQTWGIMKADVKLMTFGNFHQSIKGVNKSPIIFDNYALHALFFESAKRIDGLKEAIQNKDRRIKVLEERLRVLDEDNTQMADELQAVVLKTSPLNKIVVKIKNILKGWR